MSYGGDTRDFTQGQYHVLCGSSVLELVIYAAVLVPVVFNIYRYLYTQNKYKDYMVTLFYVSALSLIVFRLLYYLQISIQDCTQSHNGFRFYLITDNLASYSNFCMGLCLAYTQLNALFPLITMYEMIKGGREI